MIKSIIDDAGTSCNAKMQNSRLIRRAKEATESYDYSGLGAVQDNNWISGFLRKKGTWVIMIDTGRKLSFSK